MSVDRYIDQSFELYVQAAGKFSTTPIGKKEYRDLLFSAATALKDCQDSSESHPYVMVRVGDLYMKAKKIGDNLDVSFMDQETFKLTVKFKEDQQCPTKQQSK